MKLCGAFIGITDPRRVQGRRITLSQLLSISVLSILSGYPGYRGMERFGRAHRGALTLELGLKHGPVGRMTYRDVLKEIDDAQLVSCFNRWALSFAPEGKWISGDGKALASTVSDPNGKGQDFEAVVSLFAQESGPTVALANYRNKDKEVGEGDLVRTLCGLLKGMGAVICLDALHTQKKH